MENNIKNNIENKLIDFLLENYYGIENLLNNDNFPNNINKKVFQTIFPNIPIKTNNIIINDENKKIILHSLNEFLTKESKFYQLKYINDYAHKNLTKNELLQFEEKIDFLNTYKEEFLEKNLSFANININELIEKLKFRYFLYLKFDFKEMENNINIPELIKVFFALQTLNIYDKKDFYRISAGGGAFSIKFLADEYNLNFIKKELDFLIQKKIIVNVNNYQVPKESNYNTIINFPEKTLHLFLRFKQYLTNEENKINLEELSEINFNSITKNIYKKIKSIDQIIISNKQNKTNFLDELSNIYHPTLQF